ncbi:MAG: DUF2442 domain-containing protein [Gammaproteobacteria bacterium]
MNTSASEITAPLAQGVKVTRDALSVRLSDGRMISAPLAWFPRLLHASLEERNSWRLIGKGRGIHWEAIDEDVSVEGLLAGRGSGESQESLRRWLESRSEQSGR